MVSELALKLSRPFGNQRFYVCCSTPLDLHEDDECAAVPSAAELSRGEARVRPAAAPGRALERGGARARAGEPIARAPWDACVPALG